MKPIIEKRVFICYYLFMTETEQKFIVQDSQFRGPLEVLLDLIEEKKLDITAISLAAVTSDFLKYVENLPQSNRILADFLNILAKLLLIKSRSVLPSLVISEEEDKDLNLLEWRLKELKRYRDAGKTLNKMLAQKNYAFSREAFTGIQPIFYPPRNLNVNEFASAFGKIFETVFAGQKVWELPRPINLEEKISEVMDSVARAFKLSFKTLIQKRDREEIIVLFMAILHLARNAGIIIKQEGNFGEITLEKLL